MLLENLPFKDKSQTSKTKWKNAFFSVSSRRKVIQVRRNVNYKDSDMYEEENEKDETFYSLI